MKLKLNKPIAIGAVVILGLGVLYIASSGSNNVLLAKAAVESVLKDPSSVQYRNISEYYPASVCGEFNARNAMGGYTGFKIFIFEGDKGRIELSPDANRIEVVCSDLKKQQDENQEKIEKVLGR